MVEEEQEQALSDPELLVDSDFLLNVTSKDE